MKREGIAKTSSDSASWMVERYPFFVFLVRGFVLFGAAGADGMTAFKRMRLARADEKSKNSNRSVVFNRLGQMRNQKSKIDP